METVYILVNQSMPGLVKIGRTYKEADERAAELSASTGVPTEFQVYKAYSVSDSKAFEDMLHNRFIDYRVNSSREFFKIDPDLVIEIINSEYAPSRQDPKAIYDREDDLLLRAVAVVKANPRVWPGMIAGYLKVPHEEATRVVQRLAACGHIDNEGNSRLYVPPRKTFRRTNEGAEVSKSQPPPAIQSSSSNGETHPKRYRTGYEHPIMRGALVVSLLLIVAGFATSNAFVIILGGMIWVIFHNMFND